MIEIPRIELTRSEISKRLPHRDTALFLQRAAIVSTGKEALGWIDSTWRFLRERGLQTNKVPQTLILEGAAQTLALAGEIGDGLIPVLTGVKEAHLVNLDDNPDSIEFWARLGRIRSSFPIGTVGSGDASVRDGASGLVLAEYRFSFSVLTIYNLEELVKKNGQSFVV